MTVLAGVTVRTGMYIVDRVATGTARRGGGELIVSMTVVAGNKTVVSRQTVAGQVMVKLDIFPVRLRVAAVALLAKPAFVRIIFCMATGASVRRIAERLVGAVAVGASGA
ncbi:MAG: hypothetical protein ACR2RD_06315 [Woeseiaceae bacterium]